MLVLELAFHEFAKIFFLQEIASVEKAEKLSEEKKLSEQAQLVFEDEAKLVHPLKKPIQIGELEQVGESEGLDVTSSVQLQTLATSSVAKERSKPDVLKVQHPHMFGVC